MNAKTRLEKLETQAAPHGHCPHDHVLARFIKPDGSDSIAGDGAKNQFEKFGRYLCVKGCDKLRV
jgi:hypothetical protein